jgi:glycosyltransferase involved in cell wall biosynthesis
MPYVGGPLTVVKPHKPRILIIGALPPPAVGPSVAMERLIASKELNQQFDVCFLDISDRRAPGNMGRLDWTNVVLGLRHASQCVWRLITQRPALVYVAISQGTWGYLRDLTFILPSIALRRKIVLHLRGSEFRAFYDGMPFWLRWLTRFVLARTDRMIVLGRNLTKVFEGLMDPARLVVIPNGIDFTQFPRRADERAGQGTGSRLLYLSSLKKRKGFLLLLEALPRVFAEHPEATLTVAGLWQNESEQVEAESLIARNGLADKLRFVGEVTGLDKVRLFLEHDVFVFTPIKPEGMPLVILEAMSASLPVVTTNRGAISEVVEHRQTGLIVEPTPDQVAEGLNRLIEDPDMARRMGRCGRQRIESQFSEETYLSKLVATLLAVARGQVGLATATGQPDLVSARSGAEAPKY